MELQFKNVTKSTKSVYNEFVKFHSEEHRHEYLFKAILILIVVVYMTIFNIIYKNYISAIIIILAVVLIGIYREKEQKNVTKRELNSSKIKNSEDIEYCFYNKYFTTKVNENKQKVRYYKIYKVYSDNKNFYLYLDKTHAFILNKKGFTKGTPDEFNKFILKKNRLRILRIFKLN